MVKIWSIKLAISTNLNTNRSLLLLALMEVTLLMYIYGFRNVLKNLEEMKIRLSSLSKFYWLVNWLVVTPAVLAFITIVTWINFTPCYYGDYVFPSWVQVNYFFNTLHSIKCSY